jgi:DNA-3-methyladenine glycosylase
MHGMLNVVTGPVGCPATVLIRVVERINGPGKLTKAMGVTGALNEKPASERTGVWFSEGSKPRPNSIVRSARIGVGYASEV